MVTPESAPRLTLAVEPPMRSARNSSGSLYDAGAATRRTVGWRAPTSSANQGVLANLTTLRDRSRSATRNDGYAKSVVDKLVTNIIGTGITPRSKAADPAFRTLVDALWLRWSYESDADGLLDFEGQCGQAVRTWLEGGESFARLRDRTPADGLSVPLQVQLLEPELCPHTHTVASGTSRIRAGIEFNGVGKRVAYWFHPSRPELDDYDASQLRRIPAASVVHMFDPLRPGQLRGIPHLTQSLIGLFELGKYRDAQLLRQQLSNMFVGFLKRKASTAAEEEIDPLTGLPVVRDATDGKPTLTLAPGIFQEIEDGESVEFSDPPDANGYADFMRQELYGIASASGVPYEVLTGDMRGVNDRTVRVILNEFRRRIAAYQWQVVIFQFCRRVRQAWFDAAYLSGALPIGDDYLTNPEIYTATEWAPQSFPYIHPVQDVEAQERSVRAGFRSRDSVIAENGDSAEQVDAEQAAANKRADGLGLKHDSDGRQSKASAPAAATAPEPDPEPQAQPAGAAA